MAECVLVVGRPRLARAARGELDGEQEESLSQSWGSPAMTASY